MLLVNLSQDSNIVNKYISNTLLQEITKCVQEKKKVILYLNKRGNFSSLICSDCQYLYTCNQCDASLHVHKYPEQILCHICGASAPIPSTCKLCHKNNLKCIWVGTQQIEEFLQKYFEKDALHIFRFDTDVVKNKSDKQNALKNLEQADIIIGTKMITTWFDFKNIGLVWVILLEQELQIPKYNTKEKVYSNIKQLLGRGSRNWEISNIVIQTFIPENDTIQSIVSGNYKDFFSKILEERKLFWYPPYTEMITIEYRHTNLEKTLHFLENIKNKLDLQNIENKMSIIIAPKAIKKQNQYYRNLILKWENLRNFIECIRPEIMRNKWLIVIFE